MIVGTPRLTRSDEWLVWTPAALAQLNHNPPMPIENPALGAGTSPLLMSLPVRHYSMLFRPQLWGFFVFDSERGFAWFWNAKIFGLLLSYFLLFRLLTGGHVLMAMLGSIAVSYSSCVQWFFSSPTMLPELMASWALMLVAGKSLFRVASAWKKFSAATVLGACAINFILCCYPPFQIPLVYLGLALFSAFLWERRGRSFHGGFVWLAGTLLLVLLVLWPTFSVARPTLEIISQTSYPGARRGAGGTMSVAQLFSGLLNFFDGSRPPPAIFPNTSEASNFFPIWLAAIAGLLWRWTHRSKHGQPPPTIGSSTPLFVVLTAFILFFSFYSVVGLPPWLCQISGLSLVTEKRALLAIGIAGLLITFLSLRADGAALVRGRARFWIPVFIGIAVHSYFLPVRSLIPAYLSLGYLALCGALATLLGTLYFCAKPYVFASAFSGTLLLNNFLVNPISEGLPILLRSAPARHIAAIQQSDPTAGWAIYERGFAAQFFVASGARVLNGAKTVPNLDLLGRLDPTGAARNTYNRYAFTSLGLPRAGDTTATFEPMAGDFCLLFVSPFDRILREAGLKYVVFPRLLSPAEMGSMKLIDALPQNLLWIYELERFAPGIDPTIGKR